MASQALCFRSHPLGAQGFGQFRRCGGMVGVGVTVYDIFELQTIAPDAFAQLVHKVEVHIQSQRLTAGLIDQQVGAAALGMGKNNRFQLGR